MRTVRLNNTDVQVSALCLGTMYFGTTIEKEMSFSILDEYIQAGGRFLDTANKYASWIPGFQGGESENLLGQWMKERKNRNELIIATKVGLPMPGVDKGLQSKQIIEECEKSLGRLQTDVIDLYYAHADDRQTPLEESFRAFDSLVKAGKVRFIGASNYYSWRLKESLMISEQKQWAQFCCVQLKYSCLQPRPGVPLEFPIQMSANDEIFELCKESKLTMLAYSPLMSGIYGREDKSLHAAYDNDDNKAIIKQIRNLAAELSVTPNQIVLAWLMYHQNPTVIPVVGVSTLEQIRNNIKSLDVRLNDDQYETIENIREKES